MPTHKASSMSIREQIALKRAEAKKTSAKSTPTEGTFPDLGGLEDAIPDADKGTDTVDLGRWSVKETIERARTTGGPTFLS